MKFRLRVAIGGIFLTGVFLCSAGSAGAKIWHDLGLRTSFSAADKREYFQQYDVFFNFGIPLEWRNSSGWGVGTRFESALGALHGGGETGFIGSGGPGVSFNQSGTGTSLDLGVDVNLLTRSRFRNHDYGTPVLFGAYLGLSYRFDNGLRAEYRLHHISNGHLLTPHSSNPGLDLHMFGVSWGF